MVRSSPLMDGQVKFETLNPTMLLRAASSFQGGSTVRNAMATLAYFDFE